MTAAALRLQRSPRSDAALNARELAWWNANAATIARVWEMPVEVSRVVRGRYLERARNFFLEGRERATVLELGCGSGWVGQALAGPRLAIVGVDFSQAQIDLALGRARRTGVEAYCRYFVSTPGERPQALPQVDAALIHAYLHHLDDEEIDGALAEVRAALSPGARVWIYEPAFRTAPAPARRPALRSRLGMRLCAVGARLLRVAGGLLGLRDEAVDARFQALAGEAQRNGWYLSPKEVPLQEEAFTRRLERTFRVRSSYWATLHLVGWAYECALLEDSVLRKLACALYLRMARAVDAWALRDEAMVAAATTPPAHAFRVWECEVRA